ncbi:MAG: hypothetical protein ACPG4T_10390 [Nannocystaceae bacterium]
MCSALRCRPEQLYDALESCKRVEKLEAIVRELEHRCIELGSKVGGSSSSSDCKCDKLEKRCDQIVAFCVENVCPGNVPYSRKTIDDHSQKSQIPLKNVVEVPNNNDFVNAFPVAPGQAIRLTHATRPGFIPKIINIDLHLANNSTNYLDIKIEFYLIGGETPQMIGNGYEGNNFLNKDGTQIMVEWPRYKGRPVEVGFHERVEVVIRHGGLQNALQAATVRLHHDLKEWYRLCNTLGTGDCPVT